LELSGNQSSAGQAAPVVVFGGYGTFGRHVVDELARRGVPLTIAGRDKHKASAAAKQLGPPHRALAADLGDRASCLAAVNGHAVAVNCAGPFSQFDEALLDACLQAGCHYVDIADDRAYAARVREFGPRFADRGLTGAYGCSSLPSISGAAALVARAGTAAEVVRVRCTLFIGNDNPKGMAAVTSAASLLGRKIAAPQGELRGFRDRETVPLPEPFGSRSVLNFESPDYDLLPVLLGAKSVSVKVGFELRLSNMIFSLFATLAPRIGRWCVPRLVGLSGLLRGIGSSGGAVMSELFFADGSTRRVAIVARQDGQRLAALPAVYVAERLSRGLECPRGAVTAYDVLGAKELIEQLVADGYEHVI
jgi:hypothetical protein